MHQGFTKWPDAIDDVWREDGWVRVEAECLKEGVERINLRANASCRGVSAEDASSP